MKEQLIVFGESFVFALAAILIMWIVKLFRDWRTPFDDNHEIEEKSNAAVGLRRAGLFLGLSIGLSGALAQSGGSEGFWFQLKWFAIDATVVVVMLMIARFFNDVAILNKIKNDQAVKDGNTAVGFVECGSYIATGFILYGVFSSEGGGFQAAVAFAVLGQISLFILFGIYQLITPFDVHEEISNGNAAAGLAVGGMLIALGIILKSTVSGAFITWIESLTDFGIFTLYGIILLLVFRWIIDQLFFPHTKLSVEIHRDKNVAALAVTEGAIIGLAVIISHII